MPCWRNNGRGIAPPTPPNPHLKPRYSPAELFRRSIKVDASLFPVLKDEKQHDSWHRSFSNQAAAQHLSNVLDPDYAPTLPEDYELFELHQKFMYAVLDKTVQTDNGKEIVRKYHCSRDAQSVYKELLTLHTSSTKAEMSAGDLLTYITTTSIGDGKWKGSTESYITHWNDQVRKYHNQKTDLKDKISDSVKRVLLQKAVDSIPALQNVKSTAAVLQVQTGFPLSFDEYVSLLKSAASTWTITAPR